MNHPTGAAGVVIDADICGSPGETPIVDKPRLRGWIHVFCAVAALAAGSVLVAASFTVSSWGAGCAALVYTLAVVAMFAVSAAYHRVPWTSSSTRAWMRRLDHSMIYVFIAGTYTPFAVLNMPNSTGHLVLAIVWGGAFAGIGLTLSWPEAPRGLGVVLYLLLGWVAVWYAGQIVHSAGVVAAVLLGLGGVLYSVGAVCYGLRRPDPWPRTFGYHELFHACTAAAAACHFVAVFLVVL
jgi:hemolysin III